MNVQRSPVQPPSPGVGRRSDSTFLGTEPHARFQHLHELNRSGEHVHSTTFASIPGRTSVFRTFAPPLRGYLSHLPFSRPRSHTHTRETHAGTRLIRTHTYERLSRLNIFITIFCDQKINSIMCYALIKLRLSIDHGYVLHLRRFRRLRIEITYCVGSSVRWPGAVALVGYFTFFPYLYLILFFIRFSFIFISYRLPLNETRATVFEGKEEETRGRYRSDT